jgi:hypothetical protein
MALWRSPAVCLNRRAENVAPGAILDHQPRNGLQPSDRYAVVVDLI